jgi:hypothetical protein
VAYDPSGQEDACMERNAYLSAIHKAIRALSEAWIVLSQGASAPRYERTTTRRVVSED